MVLHGIQRHFGDIRAGERNCAERFGRSETCNVTIDDTESLIEKAVAESTFVSEVEVKEGDRLLLLSTCSYEFANGCYMLLGVMQQVPDWLMQIRPILNADFEIAE